MKHNRVLTAVLTGIILTSGAAASRAAEGSAPNFTLRDLSGGTVTLSSLTEQGPVLLEFWATWCPYCRKTIPDVKKLREEFPRSELAILGINGQEAHDKVAAFVKAQGINYPILMDDELVVSNLYGASGIPYFVLISRDGNVAATDYSVSPRLMEKIRALTAQSGKSK